MWFSRGSGPATFGQKLNFTSIVKRNRSTKLPLRTRTMWTPDHAQHFSMLESEPPADPDAMDAAVAVIFPLPPLICAAAAAADTESLVWGSCARKGCSSGGWEQRAATVERCCGGNGRRQRTLCLRITLASILSSLPPGYAGRCEAESKGIGWWRRARGRQTCVCTVMQDRKAAVWYTMGSGEPGAGIRVCVCVFVCRQAG